MAVRALALLALFALPASFSVAPFQCARDPDPREAREDDPAEALYGLSERFREAGDEDGRRRTLRYLVERYPKSRFAARAREELEARSR